MTDLEHFRKRASSLAKLSLGLSAVLAPILLMRYWFVADWMLVNWWLKTICYGLAVAAVISGIRAVNARHQSDPRSPLPLLALGVGALLLMMSLLAEFLDFAIWQGYH